MIRKVTMVFEVDEAKLIDAKTNCFPENFDGTIEEAIEEEAAWLSASGFSLIEIVFEEN